MHHGDRRRTEGVHERDRRIRCAWIFVVLPLTVLGTGLMLVPSTAVAGATGSAPGLHGRGSIDEAWLTGARPGSRLTLLRNGAPVPNAANPGTADALGSLIIRNLAPGSGYQWHESATGESTSKFAVFAVGTDPPNDSTLYTKQVLQSGLNYITMRDGIRLAATVRFPFGSTCSATAPCPTVIEYSGYAVAAPTDPIPSLLASAFGTTCQGCGDSNLLPDSATDVGAVVARVAGFATVSLQMRGTGCSGGAFDLFGYPSDYDAYDAIEVVAHQDWVAHHKVGLVGISYSGLSQLPAAGTDPPGLAAIAPMSPTDDLFSTGYPGGIYNEGFAAQWVDERIDDARPAATLRDGRVVPLSTTPRSGVGQPWTYAEIDAELAASHGTSSSCLANQGLHEQSETLAGLVGAKLVAPHGGPGRDPLLFERRSMREWASRITVPVFISGAMQDEQTGPQWPALLSAFPATTPVYANLVNGDHIDSTDPQIISRWLEFLDLYVADRVPTPPNVLARTVLDEFTSFASGTAAQAPLPPTRFTTATTVAQARSEFAAATPRIEVLFDNGAGAAGAGDPQSTYQAGFAQWPPAGAVTTYEIRKRRCPQHHGSKACGHCHLHPRSGRAPRHEPAPQRQRLVGGAGLGLDPRPCPRRHRVPDGPFHRSDDNRRTGHRRPGSQVVSADVGLPGHRDRGATICPPRRVRDLRVPPQFEPRRPKGLDAPVHRPDLPRVGRRHAEFDGLYLGQDPSRSDRPHVPIRDGTANRDLGTGW